MSAERPPAPDPAGVPPLRIGWFSSGLGNGSRALLSATLGAIDAGALPAEIAVLFSNNEPGEHENADRLQALAAARGIPVVTLSDRRFRRRGGGAVARAGEPLPAWRRQYDRAVLERLAPYDFTVGMLAGFMLILGEEICARYRLLNLHPALPGGPRGTWQRVIWQLIEEQASESGVWVNIVTPAVDEGPLLSYCRYSLRGPVFDPLWQAVAGQSVTALRAQAGEELPLFRAIRAAGLARETPLIVRTLAALAGGRLTALSVPAAALDLTAEVEAAVRAAAC